MFIRYSIPLHTETIYFQSLNYEILMSLLHFRLIFKNQIVVLVFAPISLNRAMLKLVVNWDVNSEREIRQNILKMLVFIFMKNYFRRKKFISKTKK